MQQFAFELLCIPAMSAETERGFSDNRCSLGAIITEAPVCENRCIKSGQSANVFSQSKSTLFRFNSIQFNLKAHQLTHCQQTSLLGTVTMKGDLGRVSYRVI